MARQREGESCGMPIYEYACAACSHQFEEWQKITDKPVKTCPKCKAKKVERLISQTSFHLKGGGWYSDLYSAPKPKSTSDEGGASKDAPSKEAAPASPSTTTETKTKKTEAAPSGGRSTTSKREKKQ
jgi:putative FmdB family regulatory protein